MTAAGTRVVRVGDQFVREYGPIRDTRHHGARAARDVVDWLAWLDLGGAAPRTLDDYERTAAALLRQNMDVAFEEFTDGHLMEFVRAFNSPSRRKRKAHLESLFKWGYRTRRIPANPVDLLPTIKSPHQPFITVFTEAEEAALRALPSPDGHLMALLFDGGLRKAEASNLTGRRVDLERRIIIISEGAKGSKDRVVPIVPALATAVANLMLLDGIGPDDYFWYDKPGGPWARSVRRTKPIASSTFHRWWVECVKEAGVEYKKPHTTRHTFATRWRERGLALEEIQILLGHASVSTTSDLYVHTRIERVAEHMHEILAELAG